MKLHDPLMDVIIDHEELMKYYEQKMRDDQIADETGLHINAVRAWRKLHDLPANARGRPKKVKPNTDKKAFLSLQACKLPHVLIEECGLKIPKREPVTKIEKDVEDDPESLFYNTEFLEDLCRKSLA